jgi:nucleoside-diphosphate-sugar epimerase
MSHAWIQYPEEDMAFILSKTSHHLRNLDGKSLLLTGGTGFVGSWMFEFLTYASHNLKIDFSIDVVTRHSVSIGSKHCASVRFLQHDLRLPIDFDVKDYSHVMFASTPSSPITGGLDRNLVLDSTILGTRNLLEMLQRRNREVRYLNTSSGAVKKVRNLTLDQNQGINDVYASAKHEVEKILVEASDNSKISFCSPRLYALAGPGIALDAHFAIGNFIQDAMRGRDVVIKGSPETFRSYLHPIDMTIQLLDCWFGDKNPTFPDIGSFNPIKLLDLARLISETLGNGNVVTIDNSQFPSTYIPDFFNPQLNQQHISLEETIERWAGWLVL